MAHRLFAAGFVMFTLAQIAAMTTALEPVQKPEDSTAVAEARAHVAGFQVTASVEGRESEIELVANPLLTYGDAARNNEGGTVWAWGKSGRPVVFLELYRNVGVNQPWVQALTLTSPVLVRLDAMPDKRWTPQKSHFVLHDVPDAPAVSAQVAGRLSQMKEISRRFEAHEFWDSNNSRFELRLLVRPVHRYSHEASGLLDGAVFVLAHGTNPEVLLQIEAHAAENRPVWKYSLVRLGSAEFHVSLDGREVWTEPRTPRVVGYPTDPYWLFFIRPALPAAGK